MKENVEHHIEEEEGEMFQQARQVFDRPSSTTSARGWRSAGCPPGASSGSRSPRAADARPAAILAVAARGACPPAVRHNRRRCGTGRATSRSRARGLLPPGSLDELRAVVARARPGPRPRHRPLLQRHGRHARRPVSPGRAAAGGRGRLGRRHRSRSTAACRTATWPAAWTRQGFALHNLASLPHISVAGAVRHRHPRLRPGQRSLSAAVIGLELVTADGDELSR